MRKPLVDQLPTDAILFDLEETLAHVQIDDSQAVEFLKGELQRLNLPRGAFQQEKGVKGILDQIRERVDKPTLEGIERAVSSKLAEAEKATVASSRERKNAREALSSVQNKGMKVGVITGLSEQGAKEVLKHLNFEGAVEIVASGEDSTDQKGRIVSALKKLDSKPEDVTLVADSTSGIGAAKSSGVRCIAVYSQETPVRQILASKPDAFIYSIAELETTLLYFAEKARTSEAKPAVEP